MKLRKIVISVKICLLGKGRIELLSECQHSFVPFLLLYAVVFLQLNLGLSVFKTLINDVNASLVDLAPPYLRFARILPTSSTKELQSVAKEDGNSVIRRVGLLRNLCMTLSAYVFQCLSTGTWRACRQGNAGLAIAVTQSTPQSCIIGFVTRFCCHLYLLFVLHSKGLYCKKLHLCTS